VHITVTNSNSEDALSLPRSVGIGWMQVTVAVICRPIHPAPKLTNAAANLGLSLKFDLPVPYSAYNPVAREIAQDTSADGAGTAWLYVEPDGDVLPRKECRIVSWETYCAMRGTRSIAAERSADSLAMSRGAGTKPGAAVRDLLLVVSFIPRHWLQQASPWIGTNDTSGRHLGLASCAVSAAASGITRSRRILEVGCGTGAILQILHPRGARKAVVNRPSMDSISPRRFSLSAELMPLARC